MGKTPSWHQEERSLLTASDGESGREDAQRTDSLT